MEDCSTHNYEELQALLEKVNKGDAFAKSVGMHVVEISQGYAKAIMDVTDSHVNVFQMVHGGVVFSLADHACEAAGNSFGEPAVAIQNNVHFLASGKPGDRLEATARVVHRTRRIGLIEAVVLNQNQQILAQCHQVIYFKGNKPSHE
jgi:acyl-CoA thioesterase